MKTLLLSPELFLADGGISRIMRLYLRALCENAAPGDEIESLVLNDKDGPEPKLPTYSTAVLKLSTGCARRKSRFIFRGLRSALRSDLVLSGHLHQLFVPWLASLLKPRLRYTVVAHGIEVWRPFTLLETLTLRRAWRILCVSDYTRRQLLRFCPGLEARRLVVVPNTLDPQLAVDVEPRMSESVGQGNGPHILVVARLTTVDIYKGVDTMIEAMPLVRRDHPGARLRVVGGGDDLPRLRALATRLKVDDITEFTGIISDEQLRAEYAACDIFALPSRKEGFGLVYLEAMVAGKPCLGAKAGGVPEVINEEVGALAEYGNIPELAAALADLVQHPRDPAAIRQHVARFAFPAFKRRVAAALAFSP